MGLAVELVEAVARSELQEGLLVCHILSSLGDRALG